MQVKKITRVPPRRVYAITTSTGTFIADGLAHHNCVMCNIWRKGNAVTFRENLVKETGEEGVRFLEQSRHTSKKLDRNLLMVRIAYYEQKIRELQNE